MFKARAACFILKTYECHHEFCGVLCIDKIGLKEPLIFYLSQFAAYVFIWKLLYVQQFPLI